MGFGWDALGIDRLHRFWEDVWAIFVMTVLGRYFAYVRMCLEILKFCPMFFSERNDCCPLLLKLGTACQVSQIGRFGHHRMVRWCVEGIGKVTGLYSWTNRLKRA